MLGWRVGDAGHGKCIEREDKQKRSLGAQKET
jgi:hypothetical protein